ncbi:hypothetical protein CC78DRAFT_540718 [Lojkania enalia]|uniref:Poly(A) RNA polymerase mitochondrial-like central palm domain-containing protein n=1 Tax=Lojkania enalia TaxID=147567 RepID=A0A9P4KHS1_9PLEO|nr:hypothetical protein CC78DRAFT_540718 [Didymosphaeria enalia]
MPSSCSRMICRSPNRFNPAAALWQHVILPTRPLLQRQRLLSSGVAAADLSSPPLKISEHVPVQSGSGGSGNADFPQCLDSEDEAQFKKIKLGKVHPKRDILRVLRKSQSSRGRTKDDTTRFMEERKRLLETYHTDYEGEVVSPVTGPFPVDDASLPWARNRDEKKISGINRLTIEIAKFHEYVKPTRTEAIVRKDLVEKIKNCVRTTQPEVALEVFGSERTGLAFATSDIDLRLTRIKGIPETSDPPGRQPLTLGAKKDRLNGLYILKNSISRKNIGLRRLRILYARYPLLSMRDFPTGIDVQIVSCPDSSYSRNLMANYMVEYPYLSQLYSVIKTMFDVRGLSDVFRGGFGSYSIFMMIVAGLRHNPPARPDAALGLLNVLRFWSDFDTARHGISIEPVELFDKNLNSVMPVKVKEQLQNGNLKPLPDFMLCLRDPADPTNDLGRKGLCIKHVQATCRLLARQLSRNCQRNSRYSLLTPIVGSVYSLTLEHRKRLQYQAWRAKKSAAMKSAVTATTKKASHISGIYASTTAPIAGLAAESPGVDLGVQHEAPHGSMVSVRTEAG